MGDQSKDSHEVHRRHVPAVSEGTSPVPPEKLRLLRAGEGARQNPAFYGADGERLGSREDIMALAEDGTPKYPSVMLFLPNRYIAEPTFIGGSGHQVGISRYSEMLQGRMGEAQIEADEHLQVIRDCGVDLLVRPHRGRANMCIRSTVLPRENWPDMVSESIDLIKSMGLSEERIKVLDFSPDTVSHALRTGQMGKLYKVPRTLVEREQFISESAVAIRRRNEDDLLRHAKAYNALTGQRQMLSEDFGEFVGNVIAENPIRGKVAEALRHMSDMATSTNNFGVTNLALFMADGKAFGPGNLSSLAGSLDKKGSNQPLDDEDKAALRTLSNDFSKAVPAEFRTYRPDNEACRETLLQTLLGGFGEGIEIPGFKVGYLGRGTWLDGPMIEGQRLVFPSGMREDLKEVCAQIYAHIPDAEYMAPYLSVGSSSVREATREGREVYLMLMKRKTSPTPFILHIRRIPGIDEEGMLAMMDTITALKLFGIRMPEYTFIEIPDKGSKKDRDFYIVRQYYDDAQPVEKQVIAEFTSPSEVTHRESLLGAQGGRNLAVGRSNWRNGGEVLRKSRAGRVSGVALIEPDGIFEQLGKPIEKCLGIYAVPVASSMMKVRVMGTTEKQAQIVKEAAIAEIAGSIDDLQTSYLLDPDHYDGALKDRPISQNILRATERLGRTDAKTIDARLREEIDTFYGQLMPLVNDLPTGQGKNEVAMALDQLTVVHPDRAGAALKTLADDPTYLSLRPKEREDRIDLLRLDITADKRNMTLKTLNDYIQGLKGQHRELAYAVFEDEVHGRFPGLNLRGKDARLIDTVFANPPLLEEMREKGYVTGI